MILRSDPSRHYEKCGSGVVAEIGILLSGTQVCLRLCGHEVLLLLGLILGRFELRFQSTTTMMTELAKLAVPFSCLCESFRLEM